MRAGSVSNKFRRKRFKFFLDFIKELPRPVKILDIGGTPDFWKQMTNQTDSLYKDLIITILNIEEPANFPDSIKFIKGDARDLSAFSDKEFDVVFSNSVIEHVGEYDSQKKMADEIIRTGKKYFVQTPNYYFPFEPHFLFPLFQFFPRSLQIFLLTYFNMGWYKKCESKDEAIAVLESVNLLRLKDFKKLFPSAKIYKEKFLCMNKSFVAYM